MQKLSYSSRPIRVIAGCTTLSVILIAALCVVQRRARLPWLYIVPITLLMSGALLGLPVLALRLSFHEKFPPDQDFRNLSRHPAAIALTLGCLLLSFLGYLWLLIAFAAPFIIRLYSFGD